MFLKKLPDIIRQFEAAGDKKKKPSRIIFGSANGNRTRV
jgi:hypothetical protein